MGASTARTQLRNCIIITVSNIQNILGSFFCKANQQYDGFIIGKSIYLFKWNTSVPGSNDYRLKCEIESQDPSDQILPDADTGLPEQHFALVLFYKIHRPFHLA